MTNEPTKKNTFAFFFFFLVQLSVNTEAKYPQMMKIHVVLLNSVKQLVHSNWSQQTGFKRGKKPRMAQNWLQLFNLTTLLLSRNALELSKTASSMRPNKRNFSTVFPNINTNTVLMLGQRYAVIMVLMVKQSLQVKGNSRQRWLMSCK